MFLRVLIGKAFARNGVDMKSHQPQFVDIVGHDNAQVHRYVNGLQALGKDDKESEKVMKILRSLPKNWEAKITTIHEVKDLTKLPLKELIGLLMTHEITMKSYQEVKDKEEKSIALKASIIGDRVITTQKQSEIEESSLESMAKQWKAQKHVELKL
ncbi:hypothetical protein CK203_116475 [Vitis vinifera]|uniref:UBN2 domain-containing protein n=1 Tax=Vitis vinifera TaxID=29760 RepID=A0A438DGS7_VITVI|nr:hypothetical protein CK203_116475 [Vitis vinifera]